MHWRGPSTWPARLRRGSEKNAVRLTSGPCRITRRRPGRVGSGGRRQLRSRQSRPGRSRAPAAEVAAPVQQEMDVAAFPSPGGAAGRECSHGGPARLSSTASCPARPHAAATDARPSGKGRMAGLSLFAETRSTLMERRFRVSANRCAQLPARMRCRCRLTRRPCEVTIGVHTHVRP